MKRITLNSTNVERTAERAAEVLAGGGVVLYPTDTLYGLAVDPANAEAVRRLYAVKERDPQKPVSVIVPSLAVAESLVAFTPEARSLAERFLPGALTIVAPGRVDGESIGIRIPDDAFCLALARAFGRPFTATSANRSGLPAPRTVDAILEQLDTRALGIDLAIDGGMRSLGVASTVISFMGAHPEAIREGAIPLAALGLSLS